MRTFFVWWALCSISASVLAASSSTPVEEKTHSNPIEWLRSTMNKKGNPLKFNASKFSSYNFTNFSSNNYEFKGFTNVLTTPTVSKFGYGVVMGYSSGLCLKKISKTAAVVVGGLFLAIQSLSSRGYLQVDHYRIRQDFETILDVNKDGEVNSQDVKAFFTKMRDFLSTGVPEGGGFTTGFVMGVNNVKFTHMSPIGVSLPVNVLSANLIATLSPQLKEAADNDQWPAFRQFKQAFEQAKANPNLVLEEDFRLDDI